MNKWKYKFLTLTPHVYSESQISLKVIKMLWPKTRIEFELGITLIKKKIYILQKILNCRKVFFI